MNLPAASRTQQAAGYKTELQSKRMGEMIVEWDKRYSLGISIIDEQHQGLVIMANELYKACLRGDEAAGNYFREAVRKVVDYVKHHFATEEAIMVKINYPAYPDHKKEHEDFIKEVLAEVRNFEEGRKFVPNTFARFLRDWTLTHIAVSDKKYAAYIAEKKKQGTLLNP